MKNTSYIGGDESGVESNSVQKNLKHHETLQKFINYFVRENVFPEEGKVLM